MSSTLEFSECQLNTDNKIMMWGKKSYNSLGSWFMSLWKPFDSFWWTPSAAPEDSTKGGTLGSSSSTAVVALWAETPKQQHSHLRHLSKSYLWFQIGVGWELARPAPNWGGGTLE